jgi:hypothetical protein
MQQAHQAAARTAIAVVRDPDGNLLLFAGPAE